MLDRVSDRATNADSRLRGVTGGLQSMAAPAAGALAALGGIALGFGKMAAEAEQNVGAVETVFGSAADKVEEFSQRSAKAVGLSASEYNQLSAVTGTALKAAGVSVDELAQKNDELITRGADLASVFGGTTADAVRAMGSAFRGEFDPLERYGVTLTMNAVNAELAARGQDKLGGAAQEAAKKQAIMDLIMRQSTDSSGNFAREADTAAGSQQRATASFQDAASKLGESLIPAMTKFAEIASEVATWVSENSALVTGLAIALGVLAGGIVTASTAMTIFNIVAAANPVGAVILAVTALIAVIVLLAANWENITKFITGRWNEFTRWWGDGMNRMGGQWNNFWGDVGRNAQNAWNSTLGPVFDTIRDVVMNRVPGAFREGVNWVATHWNRLQEVAKAPVRFLINTVINDGLIGTFNTVAGWVGIGKLGRVGLPPGFAGGGYTGDGGKYEPKGIVHGGEYVFTKEETAAAGVGTLERMAKWFRGYAQGGFVNPLHSMRLTQGYNRVHKGIDLAASVGTPVYAAQSGTVRHAGPGARAPGVWGGNEIHIIGPGNIETWYAHLSRFGVGVGQKVTAGQMIALSGNTGISSGPHLHFGMFRGGWPNDINPLMFIGTGAGIPGGAGGSDSGFFNPIAPIVDGLISGLRGVFSGGLLAGELAVGFGKKLLGDVGNMVVKSMGIGNVAPQVFDEGGWLNTVGVNRSGKPEPVLSSRQWEDIHRLAMGGAGMNLDGYTLKLNADATMATFERMAGASAGRAIGDANDDIYRGRAR